MSITTTHATAARLYTKVAETDPERMGGSTAHYASFSDFLQTVNDESSDPTVIGGADILDIINPLQHLPIISNLYRRVTGDTIKPGADIIGGTMFGGGIGLATSSINAAVRDKTGEDMEENVLAALSPRGPTPAPAHVTLASANEIIWDDPAPSTTLASADTESIPAVTLSDAVIAMNTGTFALEQAIANRQVTPIASPATAIITPAHKPTAPDYIQVAMTDPERTAGSIATYA